MTLTDLIESQLGGPAQLRNEPVQARSTARLTALLDAAAAAIDELGYERLTTAMVAERAGASIGTVYRYFPDRIAVLQALASRNLERTMRAIRDAIADPSHASWDGAFDAVFDVFVESFRSQPGFASLRCGDVIDLRPAPNKTTYTSRVSEAMAMLLTLRFGIDNTAEARLDLETCLEIMDSLISRSFARKPDGDEAFLKRAHSITYGILKARLG